MSSDKLPTSIKVAKLKNLFWNNNSDLYPTTVPDSVLYSNIENIQPTFLTKYTGQCVLRGDYNHAIYNDKYYHLKVIKVIDLVDYIYEYQLEYDIMMNVLVNGAVINGTLIRSNNPNLLKQSLQQTEPILNNPSELLVCNFSDEKEGWKNICKLKDLTDQEVLENLKDNKITSAEYERFKRHINRNVIVQALYKSEWFGGSWHSFHYENIRHYFQTQHTNPLVIINYVEVFKEEGWKVKILNEIRRQFSSFDDKHIAQASRLSYAVSDSTKDDLKTHFAITHNNNSIGESIETDYECQEVDLSNLTDIIPIDTTTGYILLPDTTPNRKKHISQSFWINEINPRFMLTLDRQTHLPFKPKDGYLPYEASFRTEFDNKLMDQRGDVNYVGRPPQKITFKEGTTDKKEGFLWWLDKTNFALATGITFAPSPDFLQHYVKGFSKRAMVSTYRYYGYDHIFNKISRTNLPSVGFLIWQQIKQRGKYDEYEYIDPTPSSRILVRVGLNKKLFAEASTQDQWFVDWKPTLKNLNGTWELSSLTLKNDHLLWLLFAPAEKYSYGFVYRTSGIDPYGLGKYMSSTWKDYTPYATTTDMVRGGRIVFKNPFNKDRITDWNHQKEERLYRVSIFQELEVALTREENQKYKNPPKREIVQGDIFCDDIEYKWRLLTVPELSLPIDIPKDVLKNWIDWQEEFSHQPYVRGGSHAYVAGWPLVSYFNQFTIGGRMHPDTYRVFQEMKFQPAKLFKFSDRATQKIIIAGKTFYHKFKEGVRLKQAWTASKAWYWGKFSAKNAASIKDLVRLAKWPSAITKVGGFVVSQVALHFFLNWLESDEGQRFSHMITHKFLLEIRPQWTRNELEHYRYLNSRHNLREMFVEEQELSDEMEQMNNKMVCFVHKGDIKFGIFRTLAFDLELPDLEEQIIEKVDDATEKTIRYYHIKTIKELTIPNAVLRGNSNTNILPLTQTQDDLLIEKAIAAANGFENDLVYDFDLSTGEYLFDLVGTEWYAVFRNGVASLIEKEKGSVITKNKPKQQKLVYPTDKTPSIYKQINQKATLIFHGKEMPLNTKFDFDTEFEINHSTITPDVLDPITTYYHLTVNSKHDYINTWIPVEKPLSPKPVAELNPFDIQSLRLNAQDLEMKYTQSKYINEMIMRRKTRAIDRASEDLDWERDERGLNILSSAVTGAAIGGLKGGVAGAVLGGATGIIRELPSTLRYLKRYSTLKDRLDEDRLTLVEENAKEMFFRKQNYEMDYQRNLIQLNKISNAYTKPWTTNNDVQKKFNEANSYSDINVQILVPSQEQEKKIIEITNKFGCECLIKNHNLVIKTGMDAGLYKYFKLEADELIVENEKDLFIREVLRELFEVGTKFIDFVHEPIQEEVLEYVPPKEVELKFDTSQIENWSKEVWNEYILSTPKDKVIEELKKHTYFGLTQEEYTPIKDDINDENMFDKVDEIISKRDEGIKVVFIPTQTPTEEIKKLKEELRDCKLHVETQKGDHSEELTRLKEKCEQEKADIQKLKDQTEKINKNLVDEIAKVKRAKEALDEDLKNLQQTKDNLDEELRQCNINLKNIQQAKETCDRINAAEQKKLKTEIGTLKQQIAEKTREKEALNNLKQDLERQIKECVDREKALQNQLDTKTEELRQCNINLTNVQQAKETCDRINTDEQKRLKAEIGSLKQQLEVAKRQVRPAIPNECELLHQLIDVPYVIDKQEASEGSKAEELALKLARELNIIGESDIRQETEKYPMVQKMLQTMDDLDAIQVVSIYQDALNEPGWNKYEQWKKTGGNKNGEVDEVIGIVNTAKDHIEVPHLHALKVVLDEVAFLAYKAKQHHSVKNKKDPDNPHKDVSDIDLDQNLDYLLGTFIAKWREEYKSLYKTDLELAIKKKLFEETHCVEGEGGTPMMIFIDNITKGVRYETKDIPIHIAPVPPSIHYTFWVKPDKTFEIKKPITYPSTMVDLFFYAPNYDYDNNVGEGGLSSRQVPQTEKDLNPSSSQDAPWTFRSMVIRDEISSGLYSRYWSKRSGTGTKQFTRLHVRHMTFGHSKREGGKWFRRDREGLTHPTFIHWAGKLTPTEFFKKRYESWVSMIKQFERAISHEDMRDQIKREQKLEINIKQHYWANYDARQHLDIGFITRKRNLVDFFGVRDAYKALWVMVVLSWNGLYMNKIREENDGWTWKIQPMWHPFHELNKQEVINLMTDVFNGTKTLEISFDFGFINRFVETVSFCMSGHYEALKMTQLEDVMKRINNVGYYTWNKTQDANFS